MIHPQVAHRAHITLTELNIPFKEEIIDLDKPRSPEYLQINPRGLVPTIIHNGETITESAIVAQFLVDAYPTQSKTLLPASSDPNGALIRARISFFADTYSSKVQGHLSRAIYRGTTDEEISSAVDDAVAGIVKEVEPLLKNAAPFFGGSDKLTFAEVCAPSLYPKLNHQLTDLIKVLTAPFVIRALSLSKHGLLPTNLSSRLEKETPNFYKWAQAVSNHASIMGIYNEDDIVQGTKKKRAQLRGQA